MVIIPKALSNVLTSPSASGLPLHPEASSAQSLRPTFSGWGPRL